MKSLPGTKKPMQSGQASIKDWCQKRGIKGENVVYTAEFMVDSDFGEPGAVTVANRHHREFFLESIVVEGGLPCGQVHFACNSWVQSTRELPTKRVFFSNKVNMLNLHLIFLLVQEKRVVGLWLDLGFLVLDCHHKYVPTTSIMC